MANIDTFINRGSVTIAAADPAPNPVPESRRAPAPAPTETAPVLIVNDDDPPNEDGHGPVEASSSAQSSLLLWLTKLCAILTKLNEHCEK
jgi:hypothetical protein